MGRLALRALLALSLSGLPQACWAQVCRLQAPSENSLAQVYRGHAVKTAENGAAVLFHSQVQRDEDGMPTAYHQGFEDARPDPGADHICVGGDVLVLSGGRLVNKYAAGGTVGDLHGLHAHQCKEDYIAIKRSGFPACGPGHACMRWYGVAVEPRSCGFDRSRDMGCGVPILQKDAAGNTNGFYLTTNILRRTGSSENTRIQSDYADASKIPFVVLPGGPKLPGGRKWAAGDYAVVIGNGHLAFAVIGDSGPAGKLGEASRALLARLDATAIDAMPGAWTLVFPGSSNYHEGDWPIDYDTISREAKKNLQAVFGGTPEEAIEAMKACARLSGSRL